jgi:uncharacterized membrane protein YebE (DUF533 family)
MDTKTLLDELLRAGQELASQGRDLAGRGMDMAGQRLGIPEEGPEREAALSTLGKGAAAGGVLALLLGTGTGRKLTGGALKVGGLAALGGLAYQAWQNWQGNDAGEPADIGTPIDRLSGPEAERRSQVLLRAMLAAARSDGHVDDNERVRIQGGIRQLGLEEAVLQMIENELDEPVDAAVIASAADSPEAAAEIYLTSLMVIDPDRPDERRYLQELAEHLKLEPGLVQELEARAGDVTAA